MKRHLWVIGKTVSTAFSVLNSARCESHNEEPLSKEEISLIAEEINANCSSMILDSVYDIITLISKRPDNRFCERSDCAFYDMNIPGKCQECKENLKAKNPDMEHYEENR